MAKGPWVYVEGDQVVYRASSLGACIRGLVAARMGLGEEDRPPVVRKAMDESSRQEDEAIALFTAKGWAVKDQQKTVELVIENEDGRYVVRGHVDGIGMDLTGDGSDYVIDVKNVGPDLFRAYQNRGIERMGKIGEHWLWQIASYMHATGLPGLILVRSKKTQEYSVERYPTPPVGDAEIENRIMTVERCFAEDQLPDCDRNCTSFDPYWHVHEEPEVKAGDELLESLLTRYHNVTESIKELTATKDELAAAIKHDYHPGKYKAGDMKMSLSRVRSNRLDTAWVRKNHPDVYEAGLRPTELLRMIVERDSSGIGSAE